MDGGIRKKERLLYKHDFFVQSDVINSPTKFSRKTHEDVIKINRSLRTPHWTCISVSPSSSREGSRWCHEWINILCSACKYLVIVSLNSTSAGEDLEILIWSIGELWTEETTNFLTFFPVNRLYVESVWIICITDPTKFGTRTLSKDRGYKSSR